MKKIVFVLGTCVLLFNSCNNPEQEIKKTVVSFYKDVYTPKGKNYLSKELLVLLDSVDAMEMREAEIVKNSEYPEDKPLMIEGDIYTSLYEGQDSAKIIETKIEGKKAVVTVEFVNTHFDNITWRDEVQLINENGWKIDDVIFKGNNSSYKGTKDLLLGFVKME
ncbi:MAG: hypothetical protein WAQ28_10465 [Bacteroidia bacterium]